MCAHWHVNTTPWHSILKLGRNTPKHNLDSLPFLPWSEFIDHPKLQWINIKVFSQLDHLGWSSYVRGLCGCCSSGSLFRSTTGIHSHFKYSMNWECPAIYRPNLCLCGGSCSHQAQESPVKEEGGNDNVESCTLSFRGSLKPFFVIGLIYLCCCLFVFTCCVEVSCPTPRYSLSLSSSLSAVHLCANVCARFMAPKDKEKQSLVCSAAPRPCE